MPPSGLIAPNPHAAKAQDIADRVCGAVRAAAEIDWRYAGILRKLKAEEGLKVPDPPGRTRRATRRRYGTRRGRT